MQRLRGRDAFQNVQIGREGCISWVKYENRKEIDCLKCEILRRPTCLYLFTPWTWLNSLEATKESINLNFVPMWPPEGQGDLAGLVTQPSSTREQRNWVTYVVHYAVRISSTTLLMAAGIFSLYNFICHFFVPRCFILTQEYCFYHALGVISISRDGWVLFYFGDERLTLHAHTFTFSGAFQRVHWFNLPLFSFFKN